MATLSPIRPIYPQQENMRQSSRRGSFSPELIERIDKELGLILLSATHLNPLEIIELSLQHTHLSASLEEIRRPQFWYQSPERRTIFLEKTLLALKYVQVKTVEVEALGKQRLEGNPGIEELEHLLISRIVQEKNLQDREFFALTESATMHKTHMLCCERNGDRYDAHLMHRRGTHPLSVTHSVNNLYQNISDSSTSRSLPPLFLDEQNQPIEGNAIAIYTTPLSFRLQSSVSSVHALPHFFLYYHLHLGNKAATTTISFHVYKNAQGGFDMDCIPPSNAPDLSLELLRKFEQESAALLSAFQDQVSLSEAEMQCILLAFPTSRKDWDYLDRQFLLSLIRNIESKESSEEEREQSLYLLQYYIDQVELELPAEEGEEGETREMTPKEAVIEILKLLPKEEPVEKLDPQLLERDRQRAHPFKPKRKKALAAAEGEAKEEPPPAAEAPLLLSNKQKKIVQEIYAGKPKTAQAFLNFVLTLLRQQGGVRISQKGSHITAHAHGKVSVTLVRPHGRDPSAKISLKHQINVLQTLFGWGGGNHPYALN